MTMTPIITPHTIVVHNMASNSLKISEILQTLKMTDTETDILNTRRTIIPHTDVWKKEVFLWQWIRAMAFGTFVKGTRRD